MATSTSGKIERCLPRSGIFLYWTVSGEMVQLAYFVQTGKFKAVNTADHRELPSSELKHLLSNEKRMQEVVRYVSHNFDFINYTFSLVGSYDNDVL
jgi:hypothetical protein